MLKTLYLAVRARSCGILLLNLIAAACTVGPDYHPPVVARPKHWVETLPQSAGANSADLARWWLGFKDGKLNSLIERALQGNLDVQMADARLGASRAQSAASSSGLWPHINASAGYQRERLSPNALKGILGGAVQGGNSSSGLLSSLGPIGTPFNLFQAGFDSSWELDLFGGIKRQQEAAQANAEASEESLRDSKITLTAEVARNYLELLGLQCRLEIARRRLENQQKTLSLAEQSYQEGLAGALDVKRASSEEETVAAAIPDIEAQINNHRHSLALLLGLQPGALERELAAPTAGINLAASDVECGDSSPLSLRCGDESPHSIGLKLVHGGIPPPPTLPVGAPLDLLRRRPDIRKAERTVAAANASIGAAVAELFPKITLTSSVGLQSQSLGDFASLSSGFYGFGPRLSLPIFQAGRLLANIEFQEAGTSEALKAYEKTVLSAFREVEDDLSTLNGEFHRQQSLLAAETSARESSEAASAIYQEGETELQTVLDANRSWYGLQEQLLQSELAWATGHIALYKALGGGWDVEPAK